MSNLPYVGHVINVHDSLNLDIDIFLNDDADKNCASVISDSYIYQDRANPTQKIGRAYRCRLKGLAHHNTKPKNPGPHRAMGDKFHGRGKKVYIGSKWSKDAHLTMIRLIDRFNGWILLKIHNIDVYNRLIVSLYDPITKQDIREILVEKYPGAFVQYEDVPSRPCPVKLVDVETSERKKIPISLMEARFEVETPPYEMEHEPELSFITDLDDGFICVKR